MTTPDYSSHFSRRNIPFGIASSAAHKVPQAVTRVENAVVFLHDLASAGLFATVADLPEGVFADTSLNQFAAQPRSTVHAVRQILGDADLGSFPAGSVEDVGQVTMHLPVQVGDFIGRASSVVVSGTDIERPIGQYRDKSKDGAIVDGASKAVDYEMEFAAIVGKPLAMNQRVLATDADEHIFGFVILNDWSEFRHQHIPWVVTLDALEPFKVPGPDRVQPVVKYLADPENATYAVAMQVEILSDASTTVIGRSNVKAMYWTARQMAAHTASAGAALRPGDILATGTVSGEGKGAHGCLLEATEGGKVPVSLDDGSTRAFLQDGDVVRMTAIAGDPASGVGFGECVGKLLPARPI
ncbi:unnamed protein product [Parascedosporium putredinis]|uniref:Fumarylacetoacetase n=1 Tax=Parascedosporium putredinis TaxID=1442378 RepID=A0A9P1MA88_9PEZI|nr:unnamed protein product [Parascedosporium putredinis]CAI7993482.1 unnamed protein product [Parascedosporium putredinis]